MRNIEERVNAIVERLPEELRNADLLTAAEIAYDHELICGEEFGLIMDYLDMKAEENWEKEEEELLDEGYKLLLEEKSYV